MHTVLLCLGFQLTVLAAFFVLKDYDVLPIVGMVVAVVTGAVALIALLNKRLWESWHAPVWAVISVLSLVLMGYSVWQVRDEIGSDEKNASLNQPGGSDEDEPKPDTTPVATTSAGVKLGKPVDAGTDPVAMTRVGNLIWVLDETSAMAFDFKLKRRKTFSTELPDDPSGAPFDIAAHGMTMAVTNGGWVSMFKLPRGESLGGSVHFSQVKGQVAVTEGRVWMGDNATSKVDRLDLDGYGNPVPVGVPGLPTAMLAANDLLYVSVEARSEGYLSIIEPGLDLEEARLSIEIEREPAALVYADGEIWVFHPETRHVTRIDATPGQEHVIAEDIKVDDSIPAMAFAGESVFTISSSHDRLQRLDLNGRLIGEKELPFRPTDMLEADGRLYVLSRSDNSILAIEVTPDDELLQLPFVK